MDLDYDNFIIDTMKKLYLEKEKLNQIEYIEGDKKIKKMGVYYVFYKNYKKLLNLILEGMKFIYLDFFLH